MDNAFMKGLVSKLDFSRSFLAEPLKAGQYDAIKGILITLIVLGHVGSSNPIFRDIQRVLYNFHAPLFLLIAFIFPAPDFNWGSIKTRLRRYFIPILWFSIFSLLVFHFIFSKTPIGSSLINYGWAMATGSAHYFNISTGFEAFWFMHALFGIFLLRAFSGKGIWQSLGVLILLLLSFYLLNSDLGFTTKVPTVFTISAYFLALAPFIYWGVNFLSRLNHKLALIISTCGFVFFSIYVRLTEKTYNVAHLTLPTFYDIADLAAFILLLVTGLSTIILLVRKSFIARLFRPIGEVSYEIYLTHFFLLFAGKMIFDQIGWGTDGAFEVLALFLIAGFLSFSVSKLSRKIPFIGSYIFVR